MDWIGLFHKGNWAYFCALVLGYEKAESAAICSFLLLFYPFPTESEQPCKKGVQLFNPTNLGSNYWEPNQTSPYYQLNQTKLVQSNSVWSSDHISK